MKNNNRFTISTGDTLTDMTELKGYTSHGMTAKLHVPELKCAIDLYFNVLDNTLIVHQWYKLDADRLSEIESALRNFFKEYAAA